MELDAQVEDTLPASAPNPEQKHKHKKKDKHKHKHHKRSKRERHGDAGHDLLAGQERPAIAEGEVARTGSEDGEHTTHKKLQPAVLQVSNTQKSLNKSSPQQNAGRLSTQQDCFCFTSCARQKESGSTS